MWRENSNLMKWNRLRRRDTHQQRMMFITPKRLFKTSEKPCPDSELAQQEHRRETESEVSKRSHDTLASYP